MNAIILAGGNNSRISTTKSFIKLDSRAIIENTIQILSKEFDEVTIVANDRGKYLHLGPKVVSDIFVHNGPLGGIHAGLTVSGSFYNFVVACDMPFITRDIIHYLKAQVDGYDIIIPERNGLLEPLCAIYSQNCLKPIAEQLASGDLRVRSFFDQVRVKKINSEGFKQFDPEQKAFFNINTPQDLERAERNLAVQSLNDRTD